MTFILWENKAKSTMFNSKQQTTGFISLVVVHNNLI
jgi:hypothetical protein